MEEDSVELAMLQANRGVQIRVADLEEVQELVLLDLGDQVASS